MVSAIIADGYLLKKKREDKRNFLGSKYQRRYFELTADTLAYAKDPRELKDGGGDIEVFAIHELKYIKKLEDCKLEMKFPERVLRVKAESHKEHDRWYEAVKDARQKKLDGNNTPQAKQLETLKEHTKQQMLTALKEDSDDDAPVSGGAVAAKKADAQLAPLNTNQQPNAVNNRPPSPRSLLANPRMGTMIIAAPSRDNLQQQQEAEGEEVQQMQQQQRPQAAAKPRSRWQDEEDEEEAQQRQHQQKQHQKPQQQQQQQQHRLNDTNGKPAIALAAEPPQPANERLMLCANQEPPAGGVGAKAGGATARSSGPGAAAPTSRGQKLQLGDAGRQAAAAPATPAAVAAAPPAKRGLRESAEKLSLGGPTASVVTGSRGGTPPGGGRASSAGSASGDGGGGSVPTEGPREEWEDDDWDSSDDGEEEQERKKRPAARTATTAAGGGPARSSQLPSSGSGPQPTHASGNGRPGVRGCSGTGSGAAATEDGSGSCVDSRRASGESKVPRGGGRPAAAAALTTAAARRSIDRGGAGPRPPSAGSAAPTAPAGAPSKGKAPPPPRLDQADEEEGEGLAKHAAGMDHLEDNWDSDEEAEEEEEKGPPRKPQGRPSPAAPAVPSPREPPPKDVPHQGHRRIPGPPPTAPATRPTAPPVTATSHAPATGIARPPAAPKQPTAAPPPAGVGARPRGRISQEGSAAMTPRGAAGGIGSSAAGPAGGRQRLEIGSGGESAPYHSSVVHDPNVKPDDNNWVEENWDDDDD